MSLFRVQNDIKVEIKMSDIKTIRSKTGNIDLDMCESNLAIGWTIQNKCRLDGKHHLLEEEVQNSSRLDGKTQSTYSRG